MTAPGAVPLGITVGELVDALRRAVEGDRACEAAVELLVGHNGGSGHWLGRAPFLRLVSWYPADDVYPAAASVDWEAASCLDVNEPLFDTWSELAVLQVAYVIAHGALADVAYSCDEANRRLIADAVARALGVSR